VQRLQKRHPIAHRLTRKRSKLRWEREVTDPSHHNYSEVHEKDVTKGWAAAALARPIAAMTALDACPVRTAMRSRCIGGRGEVECRMPVDRLTWWFKLLSNKLSVPAETFVF
jgi:hypothetical protein